MLSCLLVSAVIIIFTAAVLKGVLNVENLSPLLAENDVLADAASKTCLLYTSFMRTSLGT